MFQKENNSESALLSIADFMDGIILIKDISGLVEKSVKFISAFTHPAFVSLAIFESANYNLVLERRLGFTLPRKTCPVLELTQDVASGISRSGEVLALTDERLKKFLIFFDAEQKLQCELRLPFFFDSECIGVLSLGKKESGMDYSLEDIDALRIIVSFIAIKCGDIKHCEQKVANAVAEIGKTTDTNKTLTTILQPKIKVRSRDDHSEILGQSAVMAHIQGLIDRIAKEDVPVLISGESGTGKELIARAIHQKSRRVEKSLVAMNCAALADTLVESELFGHEKGAFTGAFTQKKGKFEFAHDSTIFLDEIGDMSLHTQAKLLRVLQDGTFQRVGGNKTLCSNARLLAATNKDLYELIEKKAFREDLFYRINVVQVELPPLRKRGEDIIQLAKHFFKYYNEYYCKNLQGIKDDVYNWMLNYSFPGNIRELRNIIERAVIMEHGPRITLAHMPDRLLSLEKDVLTKTDMSLEELEKRHITSIMQQMNNNKSAAARKLGIARKTLREKIARYNLSFD